ncbi:hypothetical protein RirG_194570 [Rhizophagus irregularis DAOM 197198w]|uniref:Uncharacterized protein n=2 Tax=Rhizophagus irregularis TaxID=588596 RepID=A0A015JUN8_RHIIW|nr:hypothetical protein RirG_194570 [Rhizophagus irregularis DAOM 197198w]
MTFHKYSKERLSKHEYCAYIINAKKVICICDYLNRHVANSGCKSKEGQRSIYNYFKPIEKTNEDSREDDENWDSDIYDNMDEDDLLQIDEIEDEENDNVPSLININEDISNITKSNKRLICHGLQSEQISMYIQRTPVQFGETRRIETIARDLFPNLIFKSVWQIDRSENCVHAKTCTGFAERSNICNDCNSLHLNKNLSNKIRKKIPLPNLRTVWNLLNNDRENNTANSWITIADLALKGVFKEQPVFMGLCEVICDAAERKSKHMGKYLRNNNEDHLTNPELCFENVAQFKRLIDTIGYDGPIAAMTDNTKLKERLRYSPILGCIIGSTLSKEETIINVYSDIPSTINKIKEENAIAKDVRAYILQIPLPKFPPVIVALIPNKGSDSANDITQLYKKLLQEIAPQLGLHILSLGSDGAIVEFRAQQNILNSSNTERLSIYNSTLHINFSCPIFESIGPIIPVQDPKHAKKTARNAIMSGARLLTFGNSSVRYDQLLEQVNRHDSVIYKNDVIKLDRQDDGAAYRTFCSANLKQLVSHNYQLKPEDKDFYPLIPLLPWLHDSEPVEHFFGIARQINSDFDFVELIQMVPKISQHTKALRNEKLNFNKEKSVREGYQFECNSDSIDDNSLEMLRLWPDDNQILQTLNNSYQLARELAEFLQMLQPVELPIVINEPKVVIIFNDRYHNEESLSINRRYEREIESETSEGDESDIPAALNEASVIMKHGSAEILDSDYSDLMFNEGQFQLKRINEKPNNLSIINGGDSVDNEYQFLLDDNLNFENLILQRSHHKAYYSKPLEQKIKKSISSGLNSSNSIMPNKASNLVSFFSKNEDPNQRFVTQREKRWKENRNSISLTLAQLHIEELEKLRNK